LVDAGERSESVNDGSVIAQEVDFIGKPKGQFIVSGLSNLTLGNWQVQGYHEAGSTKDPDFPAPVVIGSRVLVWPRREVMSYIESLRCSDHYVPGRRESQTTKTRVPESQVFRTRPARDRRSQRAEP
jgi:hypothetical protein